MIPLFDPATETGRLMAGLDWAATPIGEPSTWPESLRGQVRTVLSSRYPMLLLWGEQFTQLYNDAYSQLIGSGHPAAMGGDVRTTLAEGWPVLGPIIDEAMATGVASWVPALQLLLERSGYREEAYFSVSHASARDDTGATRGVLTVCSEVTDQVVGERRLRLLRELSVELAEPTSVATTASRLVALMAEHELDVPLAALHLQEGDRLVHVAGAPLPAPGVALRESLALEPGSVGGAFGDPVTRAVRLPLASADGAGALGVLTVGVSPSRALDEAYESFLDLLAQQSAASLRAARAHEQERARVAALAELDRVKTEFFTGVSHEFRTPLTLLLGPLQDALDDELTPLPAEQRERVETAVRASQRLRELVDDVLTFSSLEAGRAVTDRRVVDLPGLTADVASSFRAAVERAGLVLHVDCPPLPRPVALDAAHWQTVLGNLLSNALKFTFTGRIDVRLRADADGVVLEVADTGLGVAADQLPLLFERFHRVPGARSRSHEGAGVGLALVRELTALQGGTVQASSQPGLGTTFAVRHPWSALETAGAEPLHPGALPPVALGDVEAWTRPPAAGLTGTGPRVLLADDNVDMRDYLARLLSADGYSVQAVGDGSAALAAALQDPPELVLTDVMMPGLDGFELIRALRAERRTADLPVLVLSARAGSEASVEGLEVGADDYVVKPFAAADLLARVRAALARAGRRRDEDRDRVVPLPQEGDDELGELEELLRSLPDPDLPDEPVEPALQDRPLVPVRAELVLPATPEAASLARRELRRYLREAGVADDVAFELLVAVSEAINNAVEHAVAPRRAEVVVGLEVEADPPALAVVVRDFGSWRERRPSMDRGRGSALMSSAAAVEVVPGPDGTVVTLRRDLRTG